MRVLIPAFMISELRRGFEMGFLVVLPFLVIDLIVATLTMSMGMMMLPPTVMSLPFKVLFFVLIDGWNLIDRRPCTLVSVIPKIQRMMLCGVFLHTDHLRIIPRC